MQDPVPPISEKLPVQSVPQDPEVSPGNPDASSGTVPPTKAQMQATVIKDQKIESAAPADATPVPLIQVLTRYTFDVFNLDSPQLSLYTIAFLERNPENVTRRAKLILMANTEDISKLGLRLKSLEVLE